METIKCIGCGSILQTEHEHAPGYVKPNVLEAHEGDVLCLRCFRLKHYNELIDVELSDREFTKILTQIGQEDALVVKVLDVFDIQGSMIAGLSRYIGNNDVLLVGNKRDLLPKAIKDMKMIHFIRRSINEYGLKVVDVTLTSAVKGHGIDELLAKINEWRKGRNVYVVGSTNVGKSSLINAIISRLTQEKDVVTVSQFPGTTLGLIEIPLSQNAYLIDTPGIINHHQYAFYVNKKTLTAILPKKEVKGRVYQLDNQQTLFFGGLARMDFISGPKASFVCFFNQDIMIHRTKLENADELFKNHAGELLSPPSVEELATLGTYQKYFFKTTEPKTDIVISGLGFVTIHEANIQIIVHAPKNVGVYIRPSLF